MSFSTIFLWIYNDFSVPLQKISIKFNAYEKDIMFSCYVPGGHVQYVRVSVVGTPIQFVEIYGVMPCDDADETIGGGRPDPTQQVIGGIDGNDLNIGIVGGEDRDAGEVIVIDPKTDEIIIEAVVIGQTSINIPERGSYTAYVTVGSITYAGEFEVE